MYMDWRRHLRLRLLALAPVAWLVALILPATVLACLPYSVSEFSFKDSLELAIVGRVTAVVDDDGQHHTSVTVEVDTVIAGEPPPTIEVGMDPDGGCDHPVGDLGDQLVIAAGQPGAGAAWTGQPLSPYNSATWVIAGGAVSSGPYLDGRRPADLAELLAALRSTPNAAVPAPPRSLAIIVFGFVVSVATAILVWRIRQSYG